MEGEGNQMDSIVARMPFISSLSPSFFTIATELKIYKKKNKIKSKWINKW